MGAVSDESPTPHAGRGYKLLTATVFIVGEVAGGGILSLPHATAQAGEFIFSLLTHCLIH